MNSFSYFKITHTGLVFLASRVPSSPRARARSASSSTCLRKGPEMPGAVHPVSARGCSLVKYRAKATQGLQGSEDFVTPEKPLVTDLACIQWRSADRGETARGRGGKHGRGRFSLSRLSLSILFSLSVFPPLLSRLSLSLCARQRLVKTSLMIVVQRRPFKLSHGTVLNGTASGLSARFLNSENLDSRDDETYIDRRRIPSG